MNIVKQTDEYVEYEDRIVLYAKFKKIGNDEVAGVVPKRVFEYALSTGKKIETKTSPTDLKRLIK